MQAVIPIAGPHFTFRASRGGAGRREPSSVTQQPWPTYDPALVKEAEVAIVIQVNGRVRDEIVAPRDVSDDEVRARAERREQVRKWLAGKRVRNVIVVPNRLVNFVTK